MKRILFLYNNSEQIITGGQKYEDMLARVIDSMPGYTVERRWLGRSKGRFVKYVQGLPNLSLAAELRKYDLIFFNSVEGLAFLPLARLLRLMGKQVAVIHHHFLYEGRRGAARLYYRSLETAFLRAATHIVVPSPFILDQCRKLLPGREILYWQIPFTMPEVRATAPVAGNIVYVGTVEHRKGLDLLIRAMAIMKRRGTAARLSIIGKTVEADYRLALEQIIADETLDVEFMGFMDAADKDRLMSQADIFAFPSRHEGYGMALCEAMAAGLPVVSFDNSAMPYTVRDGENGLMVPDGDSTALADALSRIISDRQLRSRLAAGALRTASQLMSPQGFKTRVAADLAAILPAGEDSRSR